MTFDNACRECGATLELVAQKLDSPLPACPQCSAVMERLVSAPAVVWTKPMAAYGSRNLEGFRSQEKAGGHWAMEKRDDGTVSRCLIDSPQAQTEYCRRNKLVDPKNIPGNLAVNADGRSYQTVNKSEI